jgi:hypothetical protein
MYPLDFSFRRLHSTLADLLSFGVSCVLRFFEVKIGRKWMQNGGKSLMAPNLKHSFFVY